MQSTELLFDTEFAVWSRFLCIIGLIFTNVEQCCLGGRVFSQFGHFIDAARLRFLFFSLSPAFRFFPLSLLTCLFLLTLGKRRSASRHTHPPILFLLMAGLPALRSQTITSAAHAVDAHGLGSHRDPDHHRHHQTAARHFLDGQIWA